MSEQIVTPDTAALTVPNKDAKINLLDLNRQQMREFFKNMGEKPFRADQVMKWMYHYCCDDFDEMTDINKVLRSKLKEVAEIRAPEVVEEQRSTDGTIKWAIAVGDQRVETVYIPEEDRATPVRLLRVGCALECKFCSTAQQGFNRNLRVSGNYRPGLARGEDRRRGEDHRRASHYQRSNDGHGRAAAEPQQRRSGDGNHARRFRLWPFQASCDLVYLRRGAGAG